MLKAKATRNLGGVEIRGTGADLEELYCALNTLMAKQDGLEAGEVRQSGTNLRISTLCHDIGHALPVPLNIPSGLVNDSGSMHGPAADAGKILSFETGKELPFDLSLDGEDDGDDALEELEDFDGPEGLDEDYIDAGELDEVYDEAEELEEVEELEELEDLVGADGAVLDSPGVAGIGYSYGRQTGLPLEAVCEFRILWPELVFVCLVLRDYLGSRYDLEYSKTRKGMDWTLEWVAVRRFQIVVLDCLCLYASPAQAKSIRKIFMDSFAIMDGYCTQYVDKLTYTFAGKNAEQRLKLLPQLPRKIVAQGSDYRSIEAEIGSTASKYGCPPWELGLVEELPANFEW